MFRRAAVTATASTPSASVAGAADSNAVLDTSTETPPSSYEYPLDF